MVKSIKQKEIYFVVFNDDYEAYHFTTIKQAKDFIEEQVEDGSEPSMYTIYKGEFVTKPKATQIEWE
jgi:hypothetical protein